MRGVGSGFSSEIGDSNVKPMLVVASQFPKEVEDRIDRDYDPRRNPNTVPFSREQLLAPADGADAIFITLMDRLDSIFFQKVSPTVRVIATYSVGFEHIDLQGAAKKKIAVAYTPGVNHEATADIAMLLLLGAGTRSNRSLATSDSGVAGLATRRQSVGHFWNGQNRASDGASRERVRDEYSL